MRRLLLKISSMVGNPKRTDLLLHLDEKDTKRTMIIAPHMDDEVLGCGGLLALIPQKTREFLTFVYLTDGIRGTPDLRPDPGLNQVRKKESVKALAVLGATRAGQLFMDWEDLGLKATGERAAVLSQVIRETRPERIFICAPSDNHPDHRSACVLLGMVLRQLGRGGAPDEIICYEVYSALDINRVLDITDVVDLKRKAIRAHRSQMRLHRYDQYLLGLNQFRGLAVAELGSIRSRFAEGFMSLTVPGYLKLLDGVAR